MMKELHNAAGKSIGQTRAVSANMRFGPEEAENLWLTLYGSRAHAGKIASELDAIFRMTDTNDGCEYLFRIADNSERILNLQAAALMHIETVAPSLPIPRVRTTLNGEACSSIYGDDAKLAAFATSFLTGKPLAKAEASPAVSQIFEQLALLDRALSGFSHPQAKRSLLWDVSNADLVKPLIDSIPDSAMRRLTSQAIDDWVSVAAPALPHCRRQVIHNDFNPSNILVNEDGSITGIIDFGDAIDAPLICDLATAIAYQEPEDGFDALLTATVDAYGHHYPLAEDEIAILPVLVSARAAMVVTITHWRAAQNPSNRDYLLRNTPLASRLLKAAAQSSGGTSQGPLST